jgi:hypothetical protein
MKYHPGLRVLGAFTMYFKIPVSFMLINSLYLNNQGSKIALFPIKQARERYRLAELSTDYSEKTHLSSQ